MVSARAEQGARQRVMLAVHLGQHFGEVGTAQHWRTFTGAQRHQDGPPDQLLDEGRGDAFAARDHLVQVGVHGQVTCVDLEQAQTALAVGAGDLDRQVDSPRAVGQGGLEDVGPVGGQRKGNVRVRADTVHGVEEGEQQRVSVLGEIPVGGDEIDVLQHHHGRLQPAGESRGLIDEPDGPAGQQDDRAAGQAPGQVPDGVRLARSRRPVQEQAALEVLAGVQKLPRPFGDADDVPLDVLEHAVGQDHVLRRDRRPGQERDQFIAVVLAGGEAEYLPAEHVVHAHQPLDLVAGCRGRALVGGEDVEVAERRAEPAFVADADYHRGPVRRRRCHQAERHHLGVLLRPDRGGAVACGPDPQITRGPDAYSAGGHHADRAEMRGHGDQRQHVLVRTVAEACRAEPVRVAVPLRQVGVDSPLDIHVLPGREPLGHRDHRGQLAAEVGGHPQGKLRRTRVLGQRPGRDLHEQAQAAGQATQVLEIRRRRGRGSAHSVNNAPRASAVPREFHTARSVVWAKKSQPAPHGMSPFLASRN
jgi:hypothetical protein